MATRDTPDELSQRAHRAVIGSLGLLMPWVVYLFAGLRPTPGLDDRWRWLDSVSAHFYSGGGEVFCGVLFALALFLITYRGYKDVVIDRVIGGIAGGAALGVVLFPTEAPPPLPAPTWWGVWTGRFHYVCAVVLFLSFIAFSLWLFRKSGSPRSERSPGKKRRDAICLACGVVMSGAVLWAGIAGLVLDGPIVVPEIIAIEAFAVSWLTKSAASEPGITPRRAAGPRPSSPALPGS